MGHDAWRPLVGGPISEVGRTMTGFATGADLGLKINLEMGPSKLFLVEIT